MLQYRSDKYFFLNPINAYPFGMMMSGRAWSSGSSHRYGFGGKENSNEIYGEANAIDFGARVYDARLCRWIAVDPYEKKYPYISPFLYAVNSPLRFLDVGGNDIELKGDVSPDELKALLNNIFSDMVEVTIVRKANRDFLELKLVTNQDHLSREQTALFSLLSGMQGAPDIYPMYLAHRGTDPTATGNYGFSEANGNFELNLEAFTYLPEVGGYSKSEMLWHEFQELKIKIDKSGNREAYNTVNNNDKMYDYYLEDHTETIINQSKVFGVFHSGYIQNPEDQSVILKDLDIISSEMKYIKTLRFSSGDSGMTLSYSEFERNGLDYGDQINEDNSLNYSTDNEQYFQLNEQE